MVQDLISAMSSLQYLPFHHYEIIEKTVDEHRLQELFWNFSYYVDVLCTVRDRIQADHGNTLFSTKGLGLYIGVHREKLRRLWIG